MKKEEVAVIAQLLSAIRDSIEKLDEAKRKNDSEEMIMIRKEIMMFQKKIDEML